MSIISETLILFPSIIIIQKGTLSLTKVVLDMSENFNVWERSGTANKPACFHDFVTIRRHGNRCVLFVNEALVKVESWVAS